MPELAPLDLALLCLAAFGAGVVDAIAGGGGLVTLPALLSVGLPPHLALGTNKGQSVFGSGAALVAFARAKLVDGRRAKVAFPLGFLGSLAGAVLVLLVEPTVLRPVVLTLLCAVAVLLTFRPTPKPGTRLAGAAHPLLVGGALALGIGAYDGFFGPGTGTLLLLGGVWLLGQTMTHASADAKVVNFASNLAAVVIFSWNGAILWTIAAPMAVAQFAGGVLGARLAVRGGDRVVRPIVLVVVLALVVRLAWDTWRG
jgi:uncharacterized membrane protein YfcA